MLLLTLQSMERQDFSSGLKPEHAGPSLPLTRTNSDSSSRFGNGSRTPSLPTTPVSPRSPVHMNANRGPYISPTASPQPSRRSPLFGFASAVTNICDQAHTIAEHDRRKHRGNKIALLCLFSELVNTTCNIMI